MPTDLDGPSERKRKAAQAQARTKITSLLVFGVIALTVLVFVIFY